VQKKLALQQLLIPDLIFIDETRFLLLKNKIKGTFLQKKHVKMETEFCKETGY
jgi:hypothetical protein